MLRHRHLKILYLLNGREALTLTDLRAYRLGKKIAHAVMGNALEKCSGQFPKFAGAPKVRHGVPDIV